MPVMRTPKKKADPVVSQYRKNMKAAERKRKARKNGKAMPLPKSKKQKKAKGASNTGMGPAAVIAKEKARRANVKTSRPKKKKADFVKTLFTEK